MRSNIIMWVAFSSENWYVTDPPLEIWWNDHDRRRSRGASGTRGWWSRRKIITWRASWNERRRTRKITRETAPTCLPIRSKLLLYDIIMIIHPSIHVYLHQETNHIGLTQARQKSRTERSMNGAQNCTKNLTKIMTITVLNCEVLCSVGR